MKRAVHEPRDTYHLDALKPLLKKPSSIDMIELNKDQIRNPNCANVSKIGAKKFCVTKQKVGIDHCSYLYITTE